MFSKVIFQSPPASRVKVLAGLAFFEAVWLAAAVVPVVGVPEVLVTKYSSFLFAGLKARSSSAPRDDPLRRA